MKNDVMRTTVGLALLLVSCLAVAAGTDDRISKVPFCEMVSAPQKYDKMVVSTEALMSPGEHSVIFYDPGCMPTQENNVGTQISFPKGWDSTKLGKKLSKLFRHDRTARVRAEGTFYGSGGPYGPDVARFRFVPQRITGVQEVSKKETQPASSNVSKPRGDSRVAQPWNQHEIGGCRVPRSCVFCKGGDFQTGGRVRGAQLPVLPTT
jgi:hypothetical protein